MKRFFGVGAALLLALAACNQTSLVESKPKVYGTLEVTFSSNPAENKAVLRPLASTPKPDSAISNVVVAATTRETGGSFGYVRAQVTFTAQENFDNLTLYAYNKTGNQSGTAIKNLVDFAGANAATNAQSLIPVHARGAGGVYIADTQDFQAFTTTEASDLETAAAPTIITSGEKVLQYGFVARNQSNLNQRTLATNDTGVINLAYRIPDNLGGNTGANVYKFTATFVVANETVSRVTRDIDESATQADARRNALPGAGTKELFLVGDATDCAGFTDCFTSFNARIAASGTNGIPLRNVAPGLVISEISANPSGTDTPFEWVELKATKFINFVTTPYTVVMANNGTATSAGWIAGGALTYGFSITTGTVNIGDVVYVGGSSMPPTGTKLRVINNGTTAGDGFGSIASAGVIGNGGPNADAIGVFDVPVASITNATVPIDAVFYGTTTGTAVVTGGTAGYQLPNNDLYSGGKLQSSSFLAPDPISGQFTGATGTLNLLTGQWTTSRTWVNNAAFTDSISVVGF
jgi:hypothetical protein